MIFDLFERSDRDLLDERTRPKTFRAAIWRFLRESLQDTLTVVLVSLVLGAIFVGIMALHFGVSYMTALGICVVLALAFGVMNLFSKLF